MRIRTIAGILALFCIVCLMFGCAKKIVPEVPLKDLPKIVESVKEIIEPEITIEIKDIPAVIEKVVKETIEKIVRMYKVRSWRKNGDCLWNIALWEYNDAFQWKRIYNANRDKIDDPNLIYEGQELIIP